MRWLPRRRRFTLGTYVPPPQRQATVEEMVDDGVLIAAAAVRLSVKNLIVLRSARDRVDYSPEWVAAAVGEELRNLATEKEGDADRLREVLHIASARQGQPQHGSDYRAVDAQALGRRAEVSSTLASRLRELSEDADFVRVLVERARDDAWAEVAASITAKAALSTPLRDPHYERERGGRMLLLLGDLADLEREEDPADGSGR